MGFAAAIAVGAAVGNPASTIVYRALVVMGLCWPVGFAVGSVAQRVNERSIEAYKQAHPIVSEDPAPEASATESSAARAPEQESTSSARVA